MEIFLILLVLVIVIIHFNASSSKLETIQRKLAEVENKLSKIQSFSSVQTEEKTEKEKAPIIRHQSAETKPVKDEELPIEVKPILSELPVESTFKTLGSYEIASESEIENFAEPMSESVIEEPQESWGERFTRNNPDMERFIGENLISKIGIAILVLGIAFFVKFAIDKDWINETARVGIGVLAGSIVLGVAHKLRANYQAFSSVLVSGGISVYYFTFGIAFQEYHLFSQSLAFTLMVLVTAFSVFISLNYNREELAILSLIGGFATPFIVSTGEGNYVVLFTYLLILDTAMLVMSFYRNWFWVKLLTYVFTVLLFGTWFYQKVLNAALVQTEIPYAGALAFATGFYFIFSWANLLGQLKEKRAVKAFELSFLLSNTFFYFTCGMLVLQAWMPDYKGLFTLLLAAYNLFLTFLIKRNGQEGSVVFYSLFGLALTFITLVAPIQLSGHYITLFWAAETCLLLWLAIKSNLALYRFSSLLVMVLGVISLLLDWQHLYQIDHVGMKPIFNQAFLSSLCLLGAMQLYRYLLLNESQQTHEWYGEPFHNAWVRKAVQIVFLPLLYLAGMFELHYHLVFALNYNCQISSFEYAFHFLFTSMLFYALRSNQNHYIQEYFIVLGGFLNLVFFTFFVNAAIFSEVENTFPSVGRTLYTYWAHYLSLLFVLPSLPVIYRTAKNRYRKSTAWLLTLLLTFYCSFELLAQMYYFSFDSLSVQQLNPMNEGMFFLEIARKMTIKTGFPILWGLLAFVLLSVGIKRGYQTLRIASLTLIGITIIKLFVYDIRNASEGGKIAAFILLGVVLLIISFAYQKIKALILEEEEVMHEK